MAAGLALRAHGLRRRVELLHVRREGLRRRQQAVVERLRGPNAPAHEIHNEFAQHVNCQMPRYCNTAAFFNSENNLIEVNMI